MDGKLSVSPFIHRNCIITSAHTLTKVLYQSCIRFRLFGLVYLTNWRFIHHFIHNYVLVTHPDASRSHKNFQPGFFQNGAK